MVEKKNYQSIVTKINYMIWGNPKIFLSVGYEAKSISFGEYTRWIGDGWKKNYQSIVTKINYMIWGNPKIFLSVGYEAKSISSGK